MIKKFPYVLIFISLLFHSCLSQNEKVKFDFSPVDKVINSAIQEKAFPGGVVLIWKKGIVLYQKAFGNFTYEPDSPEVKVNTIFDLASLTKVIATTTSIMLLYDEGKINLDDKVAKFIPEFANNGKENITIKNLLLHNSGLIGWKAFYKEYKTEEEILNDIYNSGLIYKTGTKTLYSDLGFIVLGKVVEKVNGKSLDKFCKENIFDPLGMENSYFNPPKLLKNKIAPTEIDNFWRKRIIQGTVHDETSDLLNGVAGHSGLFSTAGDISNFLEMIINKGKFNNKQFLKEKTITTFTTKYSDKSTRAFGWDTKSQNNSSAGDFFSKNSFGHLGFSGTSIWIDLERNLFVVFLTNRVYPTRENNKIRKVRPQLHNAIIKSIEKKGL